jgi:hypothetical protein
MALRADLRDRAIDAKFRARRTRSLISEISFTFRAYSDENFPVVVGKQPIRQDKGAAGGFPELR